jgi:hypothetical protein
MARVAETGWGRLLRLPVWGSRGGVPEDMGQFGGVAGEMNSIIFPHFRYGGHHEGIDGDNLTLVVEVLM